MAKGNDQVLLIGDSISIGYFPHVARELAGRCTVRHNEGNAGDSANLLARLEAYLAEAPRAAAVHFNCGLHDLKLSRQGRGYQVPLEAYAANLRRIVARLRAAGAALVWARTTPVHDARHRLSRDFDRRLTDVQAYNAAADAVMAESGVAVNDLYGAVLAAGAEQCLHEDGVHFTDDAYAMLGRQVARAIEQALDNQGHSPSRASAEMP